MIIKEVLIENFFCYVNKEKFIFEEGLNIVAAKNSGGKSHLFNAFHWTFFNNIYVDKKDDSSKKEWKSADKVITLPDFIINRANDGDILRSFVEIILSAEYHEADDVMGEYVDYHFEKELKFKKSENEIFPISKPDLQIWYVKDGETIYVEKGEQDWFLKKIFPESIRKFMWFQGETVDELYDFSNTATLNHAINEISYFPIYENLSKIAKESVYSIGRKIDAELKKVRKFTVEQESIISEIELAKNKLNNFNSKVVDYRNELLNLSDAIFAEEDKLKGYDKYSNLKNKLNKLEYDIKTINDKIDNLSFQGKENFISKWMLNKCDSLVSASSKNLDLLSKEVKSYQKSENPVPITLPGPEYVQKMIDDHICYICERKVEEGTPAFEALKTRMDDFKANQNFKILSDNYTELNRFKRNLLSELPAIKSDIEANEARMTKLIAERKRLLKQRDNLFSESGISDSDVIINGSSTAEQILNKIRSLNSSKATIDRKLSNCINDISVEEKKLEDLMERKSKIMQVDESHEITEIQAKKYIEVISLAVNRLKSIALIQLINEITYESNVLYSKYLGGNTQGKIEIDKGVRIVDKITNKQLSNLNTAELTAQKLAVANAFLSLSEKKMNRSFPLLADAPTSQFDDDNTLFLTENLSGSFKQIIIMSKDYNRLDKEEKMLFIEKANICKYYELSNELIDKDGPDSRINKKTYINTIK